MLCCSITWSGDLYDDSLSQYTLYNVAYLCDKEFLSALKARAVLIPMFSVVYSAPKDKSFRQFFSLGASDCVEKYCGVSNV